MRFKTRFFLKDYEGECRNVRKFLWFPRAFGGKEIRWLEYANIIEKVCRIDEGGSGEYNVYAWRWVEVDFGPD